jgi:murein L,D-transpeptidase YafK
MRNQCHLQKRSTCEGAANGTLVPNHVPPQRRRGWLAIVFAQCFVLATLARPGVADTHLAADARADKVVVSKKDHTLELFDHGKLLKKYKVALGGELTGRKGRQGDHRTPEGFYVLDRRNEHSQFYRSLHISYPNAEDRARAQKAGVNPGGDIMVHGLPNGYGWIGGRHRLRDWTDGCIAVTNEEMDEIWRTVPNGTPIEIRP